MFVKWSLEKRRHYGRSIHRREKKRKEFEINKVVGTVRDKDISNTNNSDKVRRILLQCREFEDNVVTVIFEASNYNKNILYQHSLLVH